MIAALSAGVGGVEESAAARACSVEVLLATGYAGVVSVTVAEMPVLRAQRLPPGFDRRTKPVSAGSGERSTSS